MEKIVPKKNIDTKKEIRNILQEIEKIIIRSDVPVGISLSGGIDSSIIATLASQYSPHKLHAFSVGYPGHPKNDERNNAKSLAQKLGLIFHDIEISTQEMVGGFEKMIRDMDDPIADIAAYGYYAIANRAKKEGVPVLLAGFGGDELFWGYDWVRKAAHYNHLKKTILGKIWCFILLSKEYRKKILRRPISNLIQISKKSFSNTPLMYELTSQWRRITENKKNIFTKDFLNKTNKTLEKIKELNVSTKSSSAVSVLISRIWLISNCVNLGDRLSMAHNIELRLPLLDYKLYETVLGMRANNPQDYKRGYKKDLIEATKDIIPANVLSRKKQGFSPPLTDWLDAIIEKYGPMLKDGMLVKHDILKPSYIDMCLSNTKNQSQFIYTALVLEIWIRSYLNS